ncbi:MAG: HIT family protein [Deferribacteres bacterium]|nr:HIT family protein [Deferribacteres bacterium]
MCVFCKIVSGEIPAYKVYEDDEFLAFLDIGPVNKGHLLVIPRKHYPTLLDMPEDEAGKLYKLVHRLAKAVKSALSADGLNIINNVGEASGQEVFHVHVHIIPRFYDDGMKFGWRKLQYSEGEMEEYAGKIKEAL